MSGSSNEQNTSVQDVDGLSKPGNETLHSPGNKSASKTTVTEAVLTTPSEKAGDELDDPSIFPEGGLVAWTNVAGAFLLQMCCFGYTNSFGVFQDYYTRIYLTNVSSSAISWIGSIGSFLVISMGIFVGRLYDRGHFYALIYGGSLLLSFSLFMLSLAKPGAYYQIFLSQGIAACIGGGMLYIPSIAVVSQYFRARRALAMTLVAAGSSLGAVVHPLMLNNTLPRLGFANAARANAGLISGLLLAACLMMRQRFRAPSNGGGLRELWCESKKFARDPAYVFGTLGATTFIITIYFPLYYFQLDALKHGLSAQFSFYALVILNGCSVIGRFTSGFLAERWGITNIILLSTTVCTAVVFGIIGLGSVASVVVIAIIQGYFSGAYVALLAPFLTGMADDLSEIGGRLGIAFFFAGLGSLIGGPIQGALLTSDFIWWRPAVFSGIVGLIGMACYIASSFLLRRKRKSLSKTREQNV